MSLHLSKQHMFCFSYVGRSFVKGSGKVAEIIPKLNKMAGFSPEEQIQLYEVIFSHCEWYFQR